MVDFSTLHAGNFPVYRYYTGILRPGEIHAYSGKMLGYCNRFFNPPRRQFPGIQVQNRDFYGPVKSWFIWMMILINFSYTHLAISYKFVVYLDDD